MNDTKLLCWIASHLQSFSPMFTTARMSWIDDEGYTRLEHVCLGDGCTELDLLRACVTRAIKTQEELQATRI